MKELKDYFVTFDQAVSLKELGFEMQCLAQYSKYGVFFTNNTSTPDSTPAPLILQALEWLSEESGSVQTDLNEAINALKVQNSKVYITVPLTFEIYKPKFIYSDCNYLVIDNKSNYPKSIRILYGECVDDYGIAIDDTNFLYISPSFEVNYE